MILSTRLEKMIEREEFLYLNKEQKIRRHDQVFNFRYKVFNQNSQIEKMYSGYSGQSYSPIQDSRRDYRLQDEVTKIDNGGLFNRELCKKLAKKVFDIYDENNDGVLETITAGKMLMDLYRAMNKQFYPTATDIASYARIFDRDNKGKITVQDMERFVMKYYSNEQ